MPRMVPVGEAGDVCPDLSGDVSRIFVCASNNPVALALDDPTAGAAFCPSILPMCNLCIPPRNDEVTDSLGLLGRSRVCGTSETAPDIEEGIAGDSGTVSVGLRTSRALGETERDVAEPLIIASRRRRSSKGAPAADDPWSILMVRLERGVPSMGVRDKSDLAVDRRKDRDELSLIDDLRNTVCGTTPSFWSSMVPVVCRLSDSGSMLTRDL